MQYTTQFTQFSYSVFVVWRDISQKRKKRAIIDIRDLNKIVNSDNYLLSLQSNIIVSIVDFFYISIVNAIN